MRKLFTIFLLVAIPLVALYGVSYMVDAGLKKTTLVYSNINTIFNTPVNADVLVCGSSRAAVHISPRILDSVLGSNSYNIGLSGWGFHMQHTMFKVYMRHNKKPAYVVQVIDAMLLMDREDFYEYEIFLPYATDTLISRATKHYKGSFTLMEMYFPLFKYNNHIPLAWKGLRMYMGIGADDKAKTYKGYYANDTRWDGSFERFRKANPGKFTFKQDTSVVKEFKEFLTYCKENGIQVVMVYTPAYYEQQLMTKNMDEVKALYQHYAAQYKIPLLDYTSDSLCYDKKYFYNSQHLNKAGAEIFSYKLAVDIKKLIQP